MAATDPPRAVWTLQAERRLQQALVRQQIQTGQSTDSNAIKANLDRILARAFPKARDLFVRDQYLGFRFRDGEYILLVAIRDDDRPGNYVVKMKKADALQKELQAWEACRPAGLRHDLIYMSLDPVRDTDSQLVALIYQDAQQFIDVDTSSFEAAFLDSVQHGKPTPESIANVVTELFARVGHLQYRGSCAVEPIGPGIRLNAGRPLDQYFENWEKPGPPRDARRGAIAGVTQSQEGFLDPVDFFRFTLQRMAAGEPARSCVPRMLRGSAHGDLHGRNVLVGLVDDEAHWPALFDYEEMSTDNLPGWDFAKLETELKIRAYPQLFADTKDLDFASKVFHFETALSEATEQHRSVGNWPPAAGGSPEQRLRNLLLTIRKLAGKYLGTAHNRPHEWLEEYYFLLGCYGVYAGKFENLISKELLAVFVSAGVAAARYYYSRRHRMGP